MMVTLWHDHFLRLALIGSLVVGGVCAYLSVYVVLRRIVFVGAALAQASSAGVGLALLAGRNPSLLSLVLTMGGVAAFSVRSRSRRTTQESLIGVGYAVASALAVLFVAKSAQGEGHMLDLLSGNILTVTSVQVWWMALVAVTAVLVHTLFHKQFLFAAFDADTAAASGLRVAWWDLFFFLILGVIVSLAIRLAGALLVFAFLVLPGVIGLLLSQRLGRIYALAVGAAAAATLTGLYLSLKMDLPTGPAIVAVLFVLLGIAWSIVKLSGT
jgi:ABC-type Mn2+/Zn2+ transport system permease subunit